MRGSLVALVLVVGCGAVESSGVDLEGSGGTVDSFEPGDATRGESDGLGGSGVEPMSSGGMGGDAVASGGSSSGGASSGGSASGGAPSGGSSSGGMSSGGTSSGGATSSGGETGTGGAPPRLLSSIEAVSTLDPYCWEEPSSPTECEAVPEFEVPLIEWNCEGTQAKVLLPPNMCARISGRYEMLGDVCTAQDLSCNEHQREYDLRNLTNTKDEPQFVHINRPVGCDHSWQIDYFEIPCPTF